jgi:DNA polymerase-3 subunit gamma/tau
MENSTIITKYRPLQLSEVIGNDAGIRGLEAEIKGPSCPKCFIFSGPAGIGKTTLARIVGTMIQAEVREVCVATSSGVDDMRNLVEQAQFAPLMSDKVLYIMDEAHAVGVRRGWDPLLKLMEDPPDHLFMVLCTTEANKIPDAIKSRCFHLALKPCKTSEIEMLLELVCQMEEWEVNGAVFQAIVQAATGQPRKGLSILQTGHLCQTVEELSSVIAGVENDGSPAIALMQLLFSGNRNWDKIRDLLGQIEDDEAAWAICQRWLLTCMLRSPESKAKMAHTILDALTFPRSGFDRKVQFAVCITSLLWN